MGVGHLEVNGGIQVKRQMCSQHNRDAAYISGENRKAFHINYELIVCFRLFVQCNVYFKYLLVNY